MLLLALHPGLSPDDVRAQSGYPCAPPIQSPSPSCDGRDRRILREIDLTGLVIR
jgi:hypothetical protein